MNKDFAYYLTKFLKDYLVIERNCSNNTIRSYKKTFSLLTEYLVNNKNFKLKDINFNNVTREIILDFLNYLESVKHNSVNTRNQRLKAIKSFYNYCSIEEIDNIDNITKILSIRDKKFEQTIINYLTEDELKKIFDNIDVSKKVGRRDIVLLSLLYDTAARASEITNLKLEDINLENKLVILQGKGKKQRVVPIMEETKKLIIKYIEECKPKTYLFNKNEKRYSDNNIYAIVNKYNDIVPSKVLSPHVFRHSRAVHLLDHGINIIYIQELLGHAYIESTQIYAKVIEKTKFEAIAKVTPSYKEEKLSDWNNDQDLLSQLLNL